MLFNSSVELLDRFPSFPQTVIRREISQARVSVDEARRAGPAHRAFVEALPDTWRGSPHVEIFSRLVWLKPQWYPLTPHYHLDWHLGPDGPTVETIMVLLGDGSRTEFVRGPFELPNDGPEPSQVGRWADRVAEGVQSGRLHTWHIEPERLIRFDNRVWHRSRPASSSGWRLLMRAIRGLPAEANGLGRHRPFTAARNGYIPETAEQRRRFEPYQR